MFNKLKKNRKFYLTKLQFFILLILLLGIFFRFVNLDRKLYWVDETYTSLRSSGYTVSEMLEKLNDGNIIDSKDLQKYQQISPHKSAIDVVKSLQREDPQHPPLYFILTHFWMKSFGSSVTVIRCLAALFSLLSFPCIYWLCQELFASPQVGWLAIAVIAISPFHVLYAHEAREYSLWTVTILLSSAAFLRAIRLQTKFTWAIYALTITITITISLYTYLFSALVIFGHGIYLIIIEKFRLTKALIAYTISSLIGLILFIPLLYICRGFWNKVSGKTGWTSSEVPFISLVKTWILNFSRLFLDFNYGIDNKSLVTGECEVLCQTF